MGQDEGCDVGGGSYRFILTWPLTAVEKKIMTFDSNDTIGWGKLWKDLVGLLWNERRHKTRRSVRMISWKTLWPPPACGVKQAWVMHNHSTSDSRGASPPDRPPREPAGERLSSPLRLPDLDWQREAERDGQRGSMLADTLTALQSKAPGCPEREYVVCSKPAQFTVALLSGSLQGRERADPGRLSVGLPADSDSGG